MRYFSYGVYPGLIFSGFRSSSILLGVAIDFLVTFLTIEVASLFRTAICFLMALLATEVAGSETPLIINGVNVHSSWSSTVVSGNVIISFLAVIGLVECFLKGFLVSSLFSLSLHASFKLSVVNASGLLGKVFKCGREVFPSQVVFHIRLQSLIVQHSLGCVFKVCFSAKAYKFYSIFGAWSFLLEFKESVFYFLFFIFFPKELLKLSLQFIIAGE